MASAPPPILKNKDFQNWLKGALAILLAKQGLEGCVAQEIQDFQRHILQTVYKKTGITPGTTCSSCTTANLLVCPTDGFCSRGRTCNMHGSILPNQNCPNGLCNAMKDAIRKEHRYFSPSWKNTDARKWCTDAFEVIKCFMPPDGYSDKTCLEETDFNGTLAVVINVTRFKLAADLRVRPNICTKARDIGRAIRHSSNHLLSDKDLAQYIDDLITMLADPASLASDVKAKDAVEKLKQLKTNTLTIQENDIKDVLTDDIIATFSEQHRRLMRSFQDYFNVTVRDTTEAFDRISTQSIEEIHRARDEAILELNVRARTSMIRKMRLRTNEKNLKREFIQHYKLRESNLPISPLVENHVVPLEDFYVKPIMLDKTNRTNMTTSDNNEFACSDSTECQFSSYRRLLFDDNEIPYKNIYVTAPAGCGKTSFSQKLAITWCKAKSTTNILRYADKDDIKVLKPFSFLFLIHLRDFQDTEICNVEDMIWKMITSELPGSDQYSQQIVQKVLREKRCLVVLDGLDEWNHPGKRCSRNERIPHMKSYTYCTVLTTTRPWKFSTIGLTPQQVDMHVEITNLDMERILKLGDKALKILNKKMDTQLEARKLRTFLEDIHSSQSDEIIAFPYVLLQFICLRHDRREIGRSRCEIYSNITELTLERGLKKIDLPYMLIDQVATDISVPKCMINCNACKRHIHRIFNLGKLAFHSLFDKTTPTTLIFDSDTVNKYLDKGELDLFFKIGLLSQSKDTKVVSKESLKVSFHHKTIQEFFAALYISLSWQEEETREIIGKSCTSLLEMLEFSSVFNFVSGINCEVCSSLFLVFENIVSNDKVTQDYRQTGASLERDIMISYQSMQLKCFLENKKNENGRFVIPLQDIIVNKDLQDGLEELLQCQNIIKSLYVGTYHLTPRVKEILRQSVTKFQTLESLFWYSKNDDCLAEIIENSIHTLKYLTIEHVLIGRSVLLSMTGLYELQSISLMNCVRMIHKDIHRLNICLKDKTALRKIYLYLKCQEHGSTCPGIAIELPSLTKLENFRVSHSFRLSHLNVNTDSLQECNLYAEGSLPMPTELNVPDTTVLYSRTHSFKYDD